MTPHDAYAALRIPYVRAFALGRIIATIGAQVVTVAVGWELYERTNDPWMLGLVGVAQFAPAIALALPAGNVADRYTRRHVGMLSHLLLALASLGLALVSWFQMPVELVYALLALSGIGRAFSGPATGTLLVSLLEPKQFANAQAWMLSSMHFASIAGPAIGGVIIAYTGVAGPSYLVGVVTHLAFIGALATMPLVRATPGRGRRSWGDIFAGVSFIGRTPIFLAAITLDLFAVLLGGAVALLPVYAKDILEVGPAGLGVLRSAASVGALASALLATRLPPFEQPGRVLLAMVIGFGFATIGFGLSTSLPLSLLCLFLYGAFDSISMVIRSTLQQMITPDPLRGRVAAVGSLFTGMSNEIGAFRAGAAASLFGPVIAVVAGGIGTLVVVAVVMLTVPSLARVGPLHTLRPAEAEQPSPAPARA